MAVAPTRQSAGSATANSMTFASSYVAVAGDLILVFAFRDVDTSAITLESTFTQVVAGAGTSCRYILGYKVAVGGETGTGTWTNATQLTYEIWSGAGHGVGGNVATTGNSATLTYGGITMTVADGNSIVLGFGGARAASAGMDGNITGMTNQSNVTRANVLDTGSGVASWSSQTLGVTGSGGWATAVVEIFPQNKGTVGEIPAGEQTGVNMFARGRQGIQPGCVEKVRIYGDPTGHLSGPLESNGIHNGTPQAQPAYTVADGPSMGIVGGKRSDIGNPSPPCQMQTSRGRLTSRLALTTGARTVSVDVRYWPDSGAGTRPRIGFRRNLDVGLFDDKWVEADAPTFNGWVTVTVAHTMAQDGVLEFMRELQDIRMDAWVAWDHLQVS